MTVPYVIAIAVLGGLLLFLIREVRRPAKRASPWQKRVRVALDALILLLALLMFWGFFVEPNRLVIRHQTIQIQQWPQHLDGLRIAVLADIHAGGSFIDENKLRKIVEQTNQLQPEMIVILGDFIAGDGRQHALYMEPEVFGPILKDFKAPLGVYAVLWFAARVFRIGILLTGKPPDFRTLIRWVRMS